MAKATPHQLLWEARKLAQANHMFVVDKEDKGGVPVRILYRSPPGATRPLRLGKSRTPAGLLRLVRRCSGAPK